MLAEKPGPSSVVMTEEKINALPICLRVVLRQARDIENLACSSVVSLEEFKKQRAIMRGYVRDAARIFMPLSVRDDAV